MNFLKCSQFKRKLILKWYVIINRQSTSCQNIKIFTLFFMTNETREWWFIFKHQIQCQWTLYAINGATCITSCTKEFIQRVSLNALNDICLYLWQRFCTFTLDNEIYFEKLVKYSCSYIKVTPYEALVELSSI